MGACLLMLVAGCSREQQDWRSAEAADTIEGYGHFIQQHPESELATQARTRVAQLGEDSDWQHAGSADTADAYRGFLSQHPSGKWAEEARIRIENFALDEQTGAVPSVGASSTARPAAANRRLAAPGEAAVAAVRPLAPPTGPTAAVQGPASPTGPAATQVPTAPAAAAAMALGGFGIQLGAFSSEAGANNQWLLLRERFAPDLQGLQQRVVPADTPSGRIYRLQAGVGDEARARAICDSLRRRSQACVAVLPH